MASRLRRFRCHEHEQDMSSWNPHVYSDTILMSDYPSKTGRGSDAKYEDMESWLRTRTLLNKFSDTYIDDNPEFLDNIIKNVFGDWKKLLYHIIDKSDTTIRDNLYQTLKNENINIEYKQKEKKSSFDKLSVSSITNICGYLDKTDIKNFKLTSSINAIQCFIEMKKIDQKIATFNLNEMNLFYLYNYLSTASHVTFPNPFKFDRYTKATISKIQL